MTLAQQAPRPTRMHAGWLAGMMMWAAIAINYIDRTVLSAAAPRIQSDFHLSAVEMGVVMSAFFWSYALLRTPRPACLRTASDRRKYSASRSSWWSLATAVTGFRNGLQIAGRASGDAGHWRSGRLSEQCGDCLALVSPQ